MPGHTYLQKPSTSSFMFSLRYCKGIVKWLFLVLWACLANYSRSDTTILSKTFVFMYRQKLNFIPHALIEILQRYANLFWVLWACLVKLIQNTSITLQKTSMSNLFKHTAITIIQTFIIDQIEIKLKNSEKKLNFPIHSKNPRLGLFSPFWGQKIFKRSSSAMRNTTWVPNTMLSSRKN